MKRIMEGRPKRIPRTKEEILQAKESREYRRYLRQQEIKAKEDARELKKIVKQEIAVLKFMLKNDVIYYHHSQEDSMKPKIEKHLERLKAGDCPLIYDPYIWNYQGEGHNYTKRCLLDCLWGGSREGFASIYDVPLDGTWKFYITDSGMRGSGSYNYIKVAKVENEVVVPKVNPGGFPPVTAM